MKLYRFCTIFILLLALQGLFPSYLYANKAVKVGVYENYPLVFFEKTGSVQGFFIDLLENIARKKKWTIYYQKDTYANLLKKLDNNEIDLIVAVPGTQDLQMKFQFSQNPVFTNWGVLYTQKIQKINSLQDIQDKKVGIKQDDIFCEEFVKILKKFSITCQFECCQSDEQLFKKLHNKQIDAAVVNRLYGLAQEDDFSVKQSDIIFSPVELYFIVNKNTNSDILRGIDQQLDDWKKNSRSFFYLRMDYWTSIKHNFQLPSWVSFCFFAFLLFIGILIVLIISLKRRIKSQSDEMLLKTKQLASFQRVADLSINPENIHPTLLRDIAHFLLESFSNPESMSLQINVNKMVVNVGSVESDTEYKTEYPIRWGMKTYGMLLINTNKGLSQTEKRYVEEFTKILAMFFHQKNIQLDLEQEQKRFRDVFFNASDGLFLFQKQPDDTAGQLVSINNSALMWLGYSKDEVYTLHYGDIFVSPFHFRYEHHQSTFFESRMISKKGHIFNAEVTVLLTEQKNQVYYLLMVRNVTEFRKWRYKLEKTNQTILQLQTDYAKNIRSLVNLLYEFCQKSEILLLMHEEGSLIQTIMPDSCTDASYHWEKWAKHINPSSVPIDGEWMNYQDTALIWVHPIRSQEQVFGILCINALDHQSIVNKNIEFIQMIIKAMSNEMIRKWYEQNLKNFIAMASHELRHPVTVIKGFSETLLQSSRRLSESDIRDAIGIMNQNANRMLKQIVELLTVSRIEQNKFMVEKKETKLFGFLHAVVREMQIKDSQHRYSLQIEGCDARISIDVDKIHDLLVILLDNAMQYSPANTEIEIVASIQHRLLHVSVMDRGIGITEEESTKIFNRFVQTNKIHKQKEQTLGLGLYIAKKIIHAHQGTIYAAPRENGGAVLTFSIPIE